MRFGFALLISLAAAGCVVHDRVPIQTQVVTFPAGAVVEFNGRPVGRAPAAVILPQDTNGRLTERTVLRAVPNTAQPMLLAQTRVLDPTNESDRVPDQILIDLTLSGTNAAPVVPGGIAQSQPGANNSRPARAKLPERSKPTQPVGIDRWNPGIY